MKAENKTEIDWKRIAIMNTIPSINIITLFLVIVCISFLIVLFFVETESSELYKTILYADAMGSEVTLDAQKAETYYFEASSAYENSNYNLVESNCRIARDYFLKESQGYKKIKSYLLDSEIEDKLVDMYVSSLNEKMVMADAMYEACEYFESASRYYDKYYNTNVPYDDPSYDMGNQMIDRMGEKIEQRDDAVRRYNQLLEDFKLELEKRIK